MDKLAGAAGAEPMTQVDSASRALPLAELRDRFRDANGIPDTHRRVEWVRLGPLPIPIPNPPARRRALRIHDLHHLVTGYQTDLPGEFQISAWECGAGLHDEPLAWFFCPTGTLGGLLRYPRRTVLAYARGRRCRTLFGQSLVELDATTLDVARAWCRTDATDGVRPTWRHWTGSVGWAVLGLVVLVIPPLAWLLARRAHAPMPFSDTRHDPPSAPCE